MDKILENFVLFIIAVGLFFTATIASHLGFEFVSYVTHGSSPGKLSYTFTETLCWVAFIFVVIKYAFKRIEVEKLQKKVLGLKVLGLENPEPRCSYTSEPASISESTNNIKDAEMSKNDQLYLLTHLLQAQNLDVGLKTLAEGKLCHLLDEVIPPKDNPQTPESTPL